MKNTFAVSMTLLLALTLGGSIAGFRLATAPHEEKAPTAEQGAISESAPSPNSAATGSAGPSTAQGDVVAENEGGTQGGENGAVAGAGGAAGGTGNAENSTTEPAGGRATGGETGQQPVETAAAAEPAGDAEAGQTLFVGNCAGCHGAEGGGGVGPALTTADGPKAWTNAQFLTTLRQGKTPERELSAAMPRFSPQQLSDSDVTNIHEYIKSLN